MQMSLLNLYRFTHLDSELLFHLFRVGNRIDMPLLERLSLACCTANRTEMRYLNVNGLDLEYFDTRIT
jgi:hypothetical protein